MTTKHQQRELWRERWLGSINELTSFELQNQSWLDPANENPHWSFSEFMCCYFDDLAIDDDYEKELRDGYISNDELRIILPWHRALDIYSPPESANNEAILVDPAWQTIVAQGAEMKEQLKSFLNVHERHILYQKIDHRGC